MFRKLVANGVELGLQAVLNISPTIVIPGDHCDMPPKLGWLNCAIRSPLLARAFKSCAQLPPKSRGALRSARSRYLRS